MRTDRRTRAFSILLLTVLAASASGCDAVGGDRAGDVLATVNRRPITVQQVEAALAASATAHADMPAVKHMLERLIDEELLVQDALQSGLGQSPMVVAARETAARAALVRLATERLLADAPSADEGSLRDYYAAHPLLFEQRRIYQFIAFAVDAASITPSLAGKLDSAHSFARVRDILERAQVRYRAQPLTATAEELPQSKLRQFANASTGDLLLVEHGSQLFLLSITSVTEAPLDFESARAPIGQRLRAEHERRLLVSHLAEERAAAAIAYREEAVAYRGADLSVGDVRKGLSTASR